jgi:hypothetical protein
VQVPVSARSYCSGVPLHEQLLANFSKLYFVFEVNLKRTSELLLLKFQNVVIWTSDWVGHTTNSVSSHVLYEEARQVSA